MLRGTKIYSIFRNKCPKCHEGDLFENKNPYNFKDVFKMPNNCPHCGQRFELEPAFYYGAMYVSYAVTIAYMVSVYVAMLVLYSDFEIHEYLIIALGSTFILTPVFFRLSRAIWINLFVKYEKEKDPRFNAKNPAPHQ